MRTNVTKRVLVPGILILGLVAPLVALSWYGYELQAESLQNSLRFEGEQIVRTLANGMVDPVWNLIPDAGRPLLASIMQEEHVFAVDVQSYAQGAFLTAAKEDLAAVEPLLLEREILYGETPIGTVTVTLDAGRFVSAMDGYWQRIAVAAGIQVVIIVAIVAWVMRLQGRLQRADLLRETNLRLQQQVEERKQAETAAKASRDQIRLITNNLPALIVYFDAKTRLQFANRIWLTWHQLTLDAAVGRRLADVIGPKFKTLKPYVETVLAGEPVSFTQTLDYADGNTRHVRANYVPHQADDGHVIGFFALVEDITEITQTEARLRQAQKMEAVGQLTGGVAHDFNNLLSVIQGNAELLEEEDLGQSEWIRSILRAAGRGAELTQRLLAYSRQQPLRPEPIDLVFLVAEMRDLLARTLGETVRIKTELQPELWYVLADPGQVENALLNLAINARDAMAGGGVLTISCRNAHLADADGDGHPGADAVTGNFVTLSVTDTGCGMSPSVLERAFEPFFTTKGVGEGSGLGLSMIHGFAKQSGGQVTLDSTVGEGTTVTLYLPRALQKPDLHTERPDDTPVGKNQLVLVIEDDPEMRELTVSMLQSLGYRVIDVADAKAADDVLSDGIRVDLVLSDVVLSGKTSGPAFAAAARRRYPSLRLLFMSGYPADALGEGSLANKDCADVPFLSKPFYRSELAQAVRSALRHT